MHVLSFMCCCIIKNKKNEMKERNTRKNIREKGASTSTQRKRQHPQSIKSSTKFCKIFGNLYFVLDHISAQVMVEGASTTTQRKRQHPQSIQSFTKFGKIFGNLYFGVDHISAQVMVEGGCQHRQYP
ncbi:unnamed protein product, partial [Vitis vinifera]